MIMRELFNKTRQWRKHYRSMGEKGSIEAAYCVCRERAILDCMIAVGEITKEEAMRMEKL